MLEVRYIAKTGQVTAWCGDERQFGNLDRYRKGEFVRILEVDLPHASIEAVKIDQNTMLLFEQDAL